MPMAAILMVKSKIKTKVLEACRLGFQCSFYEFLPCDYGQVFFFFFFFVVDFVIH